MFYICFYTCLYVFCIKQSQVFIGFRQTNSRLGFLVITGNDAHRAPGVQVLRVDGFVSVRRGGLPEPPLRLGEGLPPFPETLPDILKEKKN